MEKVNGNGAIFGESVSLLVYAADIGTIRLTKWDVTADMVLAVNEGKINYVLSASRDIPSIVSQVTLGNSTFDVVNEFVYLDFAATSKNDNSLEIKRRIPLDNKCYYGNSRQLSIRDLSGATKLWLYKSFPLDGVKIGCSGVVSI